MIAFLYPKEDWTAADISLKVQAIAASQNVEVYSVPKFQKNRKEQIFQRLSKASQVIFLAHDIEHIDEDTREQLCYIKEKKIRTFFIVPPVMEPEIRKLGFHRDIKTYDPKEKVALLNITNALIDELKKNSNAEGMAVFLVLLGLLVMILYLVLSASKE